MVGDIQKTLSSEGARRSAQQGETQADIDHPKERTPRTRSDNSIADARTALAEAQAKTEANLAKTSGQIQIAELDARHRELLVSDQEYYAEKLRLEMQDIDAEEKALRQQSVRMRALIEEQHDDKTLHRDSNGDSAEELRSQQKLLEIQQRLQDLVARGAALQSQSQSESSLGARAAELANLRAAAELERQRNDGISAQIALIRAEKAEEASKLTAGGGSNAAADQVRALGEVQVKQLQLGEITKQITDTERDYQRQVEAVNDAASKDPRLKRQAAQQINQLNAQEAQQLRTLVAEYDALAQTLGGDFLEKAKDLHAELAKLSTPNVKDQAQMTKMLTSGIESIGDKLAEQAIRGKTSFHDMAKDMEAEFAQLAIKAAFLQFAGGGASGGAAGGGFLSSIMGALGEHHMSGGETSGGLAVFGESGPEIAQLPRGSSVTPSNMLTKLAESGGGGGTPHVTTNIVNQSSQPVTSQQSQVDWHKELQQLIIHTVITDHSQNGPIAQSLQGFQSS